MSAFALGASRSCQSKSSFCHISRLPRTHLSWICKVRGRVMEFWSNGVLNCERAWATSLQHSKSPLLLRPFRPLSVHDVVHFQSRKINHYVFDSLPFPGVGDVHEAVTALNYGRVRVLARLIFKNECRLP